MGPTLVLLPGLHGSSELFGPFLSSMPGDTRTICVNYPDDVELEYDDLAKIVIDQLPATEPFVIVAESFSGPVGILAASSNPPGLVGLVLVATFASSPSRILNFLPDFMVQSYFRIPIPRFVVRHFFVNGNHDPQLFDKVFPVVRRVDRRVVAKRHLMVKHVEVSADLARVGCPILYLQASRDRIVGKNASAIFPTVRTVPAPHLALQCAPIECATEIQSFLSKTK